MSTIGRLSIFHIWSHFLLVENLDPGLTWPVATTNINPDALLSQYTGLVDLSWTCLFPSFSINFSLFSHSFGNQSSLSLVCIAGSLFFCRFLKSHPFREAFLDQWFTIIPHLTLTHYWISWVSISPHPPTHFPYTFHKVKLSYLLIYLSVFLPSI